MELISDKQAQFKANLHCHSTLSDGKLTPAELKKIYKDNGYSILAITDHETPYDHSQMNTADFLLLSGYEAYIRVNWDAQMDIQQPEIHLNLISKTPGNLKLVGYNPQYVKYYWRNNPISESQKSGSQEQRVYSREYIQKFIDMANEAGYLVAYNHPYWSMESEADILSYEGYYSLEICNGGSWIINRLDYAAALYDKMLKCGKRVYVHGSDDNHNNYPINSAENDSFHAFTYIMAEELSYKSVIDAMQRGDMYASMGPQIRKMTLNDHHLHIETTPVKLIATYGGCKKWARQLAEKGEYITSADIDIPHEYNYLRVSIFDEEGKSADTRGYFPDELNWR